MTFGCGTRNTAALAMACLSGLPVAAQTVRIAVPTEVDRETDPRRFVEPHLAVDPNDPDHLLAGVFMSWDQGTRQEMQANQRCASRSETILFARSAGVSPRGPTFER